MVQIHSPRPLLSGPVQCVTCVSGRSLGSPVQKTCQNTITCKLGELEESGGDHNGENWHSD